MVHNRNKLIDLFIGNLTNVVVHRILEIAIDSEEIARKYEKELITSFEIAKRYRAQINPVILPLPHKDQDNIKTKITNRVRAELSVRIAKGYENINLNLVEETVDAYLKSTHVL